MGSEVSKSTSSRTKLWLDFALFIAFLVTMEPRSSGLAIHEWLSLSLIAVMIVHLLINWDWITEITGRFLRKLGMQNRINYLLNWLLFIDGTLIMVSGVMISKVALPALGIHLPLGFAWRRLHDMSANIGLLLLGVHTALHWGWIVKTVDRYLLRPVLGLFSARQGKDSAA